MRWLSFMILLMLSGTAAFPQFVRMEHARFMTGDSVFTPVIINYGVNIRYEGDSVWLSRAMSYYTSPSKYNCANPEDCFNDLLVDLKRIRSAGFNTIRVFDFEFGLQEENGDAGPCTMDISYYYGPLRRHSFVPPFADHFRLLDRLVAAAREADLRIILLAGGKGVERFPYSVGYRQYLGRLAAHFSKEPVIMAYDLLNEPSYFAKGPGKQDIALLVRQWTQAIRSNTAHQLITIGLGDVTTTFDWDPAVLDVDFISYHLYPDEKGDISPYMDQVYYFSRISQKPWIIGETGFAASPFPTGKRTDGDLQAQRYFFTGSYRHCLDCGGLAYSWWQYHDVSWSPDYGLFDSLDRIKPFGEVVKNFASYRPDTSACRPGPNYLRQLKDFGNFYSGKVLDRSGLPVANALIVSVSLGGRRNHTYSRPDGSYDVFNAGTISTLRITAPGYRNRRRSAFFSDTETRLRKVTFDEKDFLSRMRKDEAAFCKLQAGKLKDKCIEDCGDDRDCRRSCQEAYDRERRACQDQDRR